ncbi:long-chain-fatty-acid--CoA ligase [Rudaeicoccus suwonensis]|uniref:Long-chain acyl-CoA synthetase n=1 Tax=Rudaeicoccus suwonensis TaxID=657409 RepID=A0A561E7K2_9MICO|nr:long-chain fatty acid--CoA ligase [Rudaeicoccus suwonensis]TWE11586.1 long-chain acyl-CoA synthetase [Rudaeicoccus suwonensis]
MSTLSLASVLAEPARRRPTKVALVEGDRRLTYAQVWDLALRYGDALVASGVKPGDRVALLAPNVIEFVGAYYGIIAAGATVVPVPPMLRPTEAAYLVQNSGARLLLHHPWFAETAIAAAGECGIDEASLVGMAEGRNPLATYVSRQPDDVAVVFYTSGTTGRPKGAMLTHLNLVMNATVAAFDTGNVGNDEMILGALPLFHIFGQSISLNATFRAGATLVLVPRFEPVEVLRILNDENITRMSAVPTMLIQLLQHADEVTPVPQLQECNSGGASLPVAVLEAFEAKFGATVREGYGLSETSPTATTNLSHLPPRPGTVGQPVWGCEAEVADPAITDHVVLLPVGERGEVVLCGHNIFAGYLGNPEATEAALQDGWFRTGDIGMRDEDGFLSIVDRTKDLIIRGGFNVYPREVEETLQRYDGVAQVSVIGVPDAERGEEICAVVVPETGVVVDPDALITWSKERLAAHKYPRRVEIVHELPLGPSHKVLKRELRAQFGR